MALDTYEEEKPELITLNDQVGQGLPRRPSRARPFGSRVRGRGPRPTRTRSAREATRPSGSATRTSVRHRGGPWSGPARSWTGPQGHRQGRRRTGRPRSWDKDGAGRQPSTSRARLSRHPRAAHPPRSVQGDGAIVREGPRPSWWTTSARSTAARRRSTQASPAGEAHVVPDRRRCRGHQGWDQSLVGRAVGSRVLLSIPPDLGYGEKGDEQRRHQGHRHALLRGRHPGRGLSRPQGGQVTGMTAGTRRRRRARKSERLLNLLIMLLVQRHYVSKERIREILYAELQPRRLREDVRARQGGAAQPRRAHRGRQHRPALRRRARLPR